MNSSVCPKCGQPIDSDSPLGHCPKCLIHACLGTTDPGEADDLGGLGGLPPTPALSDSSGLQIRCPHCGHLIVLTEGTSWSDIQCDACGTHFRIVGDSTAHAAATELGQIGQFQILAKLGTGAFGTVWKARDTRLDRIVAVKVPRSAHLTPPEMDKFLREARTAAQLRHPNIVSVHEVGREDDLIYIVCDYVEGVSLADWLTHQRMDTREAARFCVQLADALEHAHQAGVIHRDLKPQNIILDDKRRPHLMDFGLARREAGEVTLTLDGVLLGTPAYMSPEQARGEAHAADRRTDIYSMGVILFQLLTGELPFRGNARMLVHQVIHDEPPSPRKLNGHVPRDLETICLRCLEKDARRRYATAAELREELRRYLAGEPILARPVGTAGKLRRWAQRKPALTGALSALLLVFAIGFAGVLSQWRRAEQNAREQRREAYYSKIAEAQAHIHNGGIEQAKQVLISCPEEYRNWEWGHLMYLCHKAVVTLQCGTNNVVHLEFMPGEQRLLALSSDGVLKVWHWLDKEEVCSLESRSDPVRVAGSSLDGGWLVTGSQSGLVELYETRGWTVQRRARLHKAAVSALAFSRDGTWLATAAKDGSVVAQRLNHEEAPLGFTGQPGAVTSLSFSSDGERLVSRSQNAVVVWDRATGSEIHRMEVPAEAGITCFTDNEGEYWATIDTNDVVVLGPWDQPARHMGKTFGAQSARTRRLFFDPNNRWLCKAGENNTARVWNLATGEECLAVADRVHSAVFSGDGRFLVTLGAESFGSVWDLEEGAEVKKLRGHEAIIEVAAYDSTGRIIATGDQEGWIKVSTAQRGRERLQDRTWVWAGCYSPDGRRLAMSPAHRGTIIWDADSGRRLLTIKVPLEVVQATAFSPDGRFLVTAGSQQVIRIYDVLTGERVRSLFGHTGGIWWASFSPDGRLLVTSSGDSTVRLWEFETGRLERVIDEDEGRIWNVDFSPDGRLLVTSNESGTARIWEVNTGRLVQTLPGHEEQVCSARFTADGRLVFTVSWGGMVRVWDVATGIPSRRWKLRALGYEGILSIDKSRLLTSTVGMAVYGMDFPTLALWDVDHDRRLLELEGPTEMLSHMFAHPSGRRFASSCVDFSCWQWESFPWRDTDYPTTTGTSLLEPIARYAEDYWRMRYYAETSDVGGTGPEGKFVEVELEPELRPSRPITATEKQLDLTDYYTSPFWLLFYPCFIDAHCDCLPDLPRGLHVLDGVLFDLRGVVQFRRTMADQGAPWRLCWEHTRTAIHGIETPARFSDVHLLHAVTGQESKGTPVAEMTLHYTDGSAVSVPIIYGEDVSNWVAVSGEPPELGWRAQVAYTGSNRWARRSALEFVDFRHVPSRTDTVRHVYHTVLPNPMPNKDVASLDYNSLLTRCAPFLIAITVE